MQVREELAEAALLDQGARVSNAVLRDKWL